MLEDTEKWKTWFILRCTSSKETKILKLPTGKEPGNTSSKAKPSKTLLWSSSLSQWALLGCFLLVLRGGTWHTILCVEHCSGDISYNCQLIFFFNLILFCLRQFRCVAQAGLGITVVLLPQPPKHWNYKWVPLPHWLKQWTSELYVLKGLRCVDF